ncbi:unnamed protein product [Cylindrotheca closterium]|uniref:Kinesin light chain n=1 Tax=Cylindrotheca closterium TaxID=2856 RepID=A0AAD2CTD0_9STRA|nr:unnamed protein product [Cylindrotheca closterium]
MFNKETIERRRRLWREYWKYKRRNLVKMILLLASTLTNIGNSLLREGKLNEALEKFERVLAIQLKKLGRHLDTADTYESIGHVYSEQQNDQRCEKMLRKALDIKLEILPQEDISDLSDLYQRLAMSLQLQGKSSEAIKTHKLALPSLLQKHGEEHPAVIESYSGIAILLANQMRFDDALQMLDKSIEICSRLQETGNFETDLLARSLANKGHCLKIQGRLDSATKHFTKALTVRKEALGEMHPLTAEFYENLGDVHVRQEMLEVGIHVLTKSLEIPQEYREGTERSGYRNEETGRFRKGNTALPRREGTERRGTENEGDAETTIQLFQESLDVYKEANEETNGVHPHMAVVYENISSVKVDNGLLEDGIAASAEALKIRRRIDGNDHVDTKRRMEVHRSHTYMLYLSTACCFYRE